MNPLKFGETFHSVNDGNPERILERGTCRDLTGGAAARNGGGQEKVQTTNSFLLAVKTVVGMKIPRS